MITDRLVAQAIATYDPEAHEKREDRGQASWGTKINHPNPTDFDGTSDLGIRGDTLTLKTFHDLLAAIAHQLYLDGDTDPLGVRKIKAIGIITTLVTGLMTGQAALDLQVGASARRRASGTARSRSTSTSTPTTSTSTPPAAPRSPPGTIERLGAATLAKLRTWVGHHQVVIQPVLNMARRDAVDSHDPPAWMRELVILRDGHCIFPRCTVDARRCDLDHQTPYLPPDEGGPPGQTHPDALACLCRRHHRAKTARVWRYTRTPDGHYLWHGPHGSTYLVTDTGTHRVG